MYTVCMQNLFFVHGAGGDGISAVASLSWWSFQGNKKVLVQGRSLERWSEFPSLLTTSCDKQDGRCVKVFVSRRGQMGYFEAFQLILQHSESIFFLVNYVGKAQCQWRDILESSFVGTEMFHNQCTICLLVASYECNSIAVVQISNVAVEVTMVATASMSMHECLFIRAYCYICIALQVSEIGRLWSLWGRN